MTRVIERNTKIPWLVTQTFSTTSDLQTAVTIHVLQGESPMAKDNISLGRFDLTGIPPAPRGVPQVEVTFEINADGVLDVTAKDLGTGKEMSLPITASTKLSQTEKDRMRARALEPPFEIPLYEGWNLIRLPFTPGDPSTAVVLSEIIDYVARARLVLMKLLYLVYSFLLEKEPRVVLLKMGFYSSSTHPLDLQLTMLIP